MSSQLERVKMVATPPPHNSSCATQVLITSARKPIPLPRSSLVKIKPKNMSGSGCQNKDMFEDVPTPGQDNTKTSAVIINDDTTSAPKGFNHLSQLKGERVGKTAAFPLPQTTSNFSHYSTGNVLFRNG